MHVIGCKSHGHALSVKLESPGFLPGSVLSALWDLLYNSSFLISSGRGPVLSLLLISCGRGPVLLLLMLMQPTMVW